jgi:glycosyltransferase involved in cell wall biosynthesis
MGQQVYDIAIVQWYERDEIAEAIHFELEQLGHNPFFFAANTAVPTEADIVFTFAPYGRFLPIVHQLNQIAPDKRPLLIHWNTEGVPDLRLPWRVTRLLGATRSWLERSTYHLRPSAGGNSFLARLESKMLRFRYVGDYYYAHNKGLLNLFSDSSAVYARIHSQHGLPTLFVPWGSSPLWYADLDRERDIDVLWMGNRQGERRSNLIDQVREDLLKQGIKMYVADGQENPFIFREERVALLNRAKITLNITRTWYDDNFSRFALVAPNRSLIVSEYLLPHCPAYEPGVHYVATAPEKLADTIVYYLQRPEARAEIVDKACRLTTSQLTFENSIKKLLQAVESLPQKNRSPLPGTVPISDSGQAKKLES